LSFISQEQVEGHQIFPPLNQAFETLNQCPFDKVKVVILGQDPYHNVGQAHGLAFSVKVGVKTPPSLVNIYKELSQDIESFKIPTHGCLSDWCKQGVLLLNTSLTVRAHAANSHSGKGWETFTNAIIQKISKDKEGVVFLLWGKPAQSKASLINQSKHHIFMAAHPSPFSADKFFGCKHFSKANEKLLAAGLEPIDWALNSTGREHLV